MPVHIKNEDRFFDSSKIIFMDSSLLKLNSLLRLSFISESEIFKTSALDCLDVIGSFDLWVESTCTDISNFNELLNSFYMNNNLTI